MRDFKHINYITKLKRYSTFTYLILVLNNVSLTGPYIKECLIPISD